MTILDIDDTLEQSQVTPSDLKAIRLRLGLDTAEAAQLLGLAGRRDIIENLEKARTWTMHEGHVERLIELEDAFRTSLDRVLDNGVQDVLIGFPNDGAFRDMEPGLASVLRFNSVHRMMLARAQEQWLDDGATTTIVEIIPTKYDSWLDGRPDTVPHRETWARQHISIYRIKPGLPVIGRPET